MEKKIRVLIVEDEALVAMLMRRNLRLFGYETCALSATGEASIEDVEAHQPDVVLMDIHLPGRIDGIQAAQEIRDRYGIPIIFITGYTNETVQVRAEQVGPVAFLTKPAQTYELAAAIDRAVQQ